MPGPGSWGNLAKKKVIPFKRGKKEGNKSRIAQTPDERMNEFLKRRIDKEAVYV
jgi:hypothetical protein